MGAPARRWPPTFSQAMTPHDSTPVQHTQPTLTAALTRAIARHHGVPEDEAQRLCRAILDSETEKFDALHYFGVLEAQQGRFPEADCLIGEALAIRPQSAEACLNHGNVLSALGRAGEALASYDKALAARSQYPEALYCRANALQRLHRHEEALAGYDAALASAPDRPEVLTNRGNTLHELKRHEEALASYDKALALVPGAALLHSNRGDTLRELKRHEEALASLDKALAIDPGSVEALNNRGNTLRDLRRCEEALASFDRALKISPNHPVVHSNRGNVLQDLKRYGEAVASYDRALAIDPGFADALLGRGNALKALRLYQEAIASYEKALALRSGFADALCGLGDALQELDRYPEAIDSYGKALTLNPDLEYAAGMLARARMRSCDWRARDREVGRLVADIRAGKRSVTPFDSLSICDSPDDQLLCSRTWVRDKLSASPDPFWKGDRYRHDRIRVAYLSADFHEHAMAYLAAGLFEAHDRGRFETTAVSFGPDVPGAMRSRLKGAFSRFVDVHRRSDREVARLLRELEIDIAVDLNGFTTDSRTGIFAFRGAPVQVNYLGYPGTMGADYMDYILADRFVIPLQHHACFAEKVVYLPGAYQVNDAKRRIAEHVPARGEYGLPEPGFVYCCFNNNYKFTPGIFGIWMRLLNKVPGSVLWLLESNAAAARNLKMAAAEWGVVPERLVFATRIKLEDHLARHRLADLSLDTLPYNAHTTTSDALWAGLPVVTCLGTTFAGRVGASLLSAIGLDELITHSLEEYEALAWELATDPKRLAGIRAKLAANRTTHPLFDTDRMRRHIEAAYTTMWERYQRGEPPAGFSVPAVS